MVPRHRQCPAEAREARRVDAGPHDAFGAKLRATWLENPSVIGFDGVKITKHRAKHSSYRSEKKNNNSETSFLYKAIYVFFVVNSIF